MQSKLIVIEGIDGTGKHTQSVMLKKYLMSHSINAHIIGFPDYHGGVGKTIGKMLSGDLGELSQIHPFFTASLFSLDRAEKRDEITNRLNAGEWIICDRYVYSNFAHQACRLPSSEREEFLSWVEHLEFNILKLPQPDITILLSMEENQSKTLREQRQIHEYSSSVLDVHESNLENMASARQIYEQLSARLAWNVVNCSANQKLRSIDDISQEIISIINL